MKKTTIILSAVSLLITLLSSCGVSYEEVKIGNQIWMTQNLNVDKFRNGDPIPHVKTDEEWQKAGENGEPAWCYYDNYPANGEKYGKLYNWYAVNDSRGLAPKGWKIPSDEDWSRLSDFLGGDKIAGKKMKSTSGWKANGNGTNESGFSGLPGSCRGFNLIGRFGDWWSSTSKVYSHAPDWQPDAWRRRLSYDNDDFFRQANYKENGFSVRCLKETDYSKSSTSNVSTNHKEKEKSVSDILNEKALNFSEIRGLLIKEKNKSEIKNLLGPAHKEYYRQLGDGSRTYLYFFKAKKNGVLGHVLLYYNASSREIDDIEFYEPGSRIWLNRIEYIESPKTPSRKYL